MFLIICDSNKQNVLKLALITDLVLRMQTSPRRDFIHDESFQMDLHKTQKMVLNKWEKQ